MLQNWMIYNIIRSDKIYVKMRNINMMRYDLNLSEGYLAWAAHWAMFVSNGYANEKPLE